MRTFIFFLQVTSFNGKRFKDLNLKFRLYFSLESSNGDFYLSFLFSVGLVQPRKITEL